jgi:plastocyanin
VPELRLARVCGVAVAGLWLAGTAASTADVKSHPIAHTIIIENMRFDPPTLTVKRGDRITWVNKDLFPHTATADSKVFDSRSIAQNASWDWVARKPGSYTYACAFHPIMKGTVTVQ